MNKLQWLKMMSGKHNLMQSKLLTRLNNGLKRNRLDKASYKKREMLRFVLMSRGKSGKQSNNRKRRPNVGLRKLRLKQSYKLKFGPLRRQI